ncbi:MAG: TetR/AcrR family transcriptional regulator [Deltaproteobacteria bacterium]|nr:TetR/AcrR family transcriptional regulator [Deltaproteobacteria bacterium]
METAGEHTKEPATDRAQQLLDAAEALLIEDGYDGLSAQAVARRAGVNKALVFYYWGSTAELFERMLERYYARHERALTEALAVEGTLAERVHHLIDAYLDYMEANRGYLRIVQQQVSGLGPHLPVVQRHLGDMMQISAGLLAGLAPANGATAARHLHLSLSAMVVNYFTYAPAMGAAWGPDDPMSTTSLAERRAHVHWVVDAWLNHLAAPG